MTAQNRFWFRYGTAAAAAILVFLLHYLLRQYFADRTFMVIYMPVVVYAAFAAGSARRCWPPFSAPASACSSSAGS
jgi:two-component system, LuxR family, sensor kinase FixL